jgi:hypothetical protein
MIEFKFYCVEEGYARRLSLRKGLRRIYSIRKMLRIRDYYFNIVPDGLKDEFIDIVSRLNIVQSFLWRIVLWKHI